MEKPNVLFAVCLEKNFFFLSSLVQKQKKKSSDVVKTSLDGLFLSTCSMYSSLFYFS